MSDKEKDIEAKLKPVVDDPESVHREVLAKLVAEKGQAWVDAHRAELEEQWKAAKALFFGM